MSTRAARGHAARLHQQQQRSLTDLPSSWCQQLLLCLSASSRLSLRSTCQHFLHICDMLVDTDSMQQQQQPCMGRSTSPAQASQPQHSSMQQQQELSRQNSCKQHRPCQAQLVLKLARRQPNLMHLHELGLLKRVVVLDTSAAKRGVLSVGVSNAADLAGALPCLRSVKLSSSQAVLAEVLTAAATQLSSINLAVRSATPTVVDALQNLPSLRHLELQLQFNAWAKGCTGLGRLTQLQQLAIKGRPLDEGAKHGAGCMAAGFWMECVAPLVNLTRLDANPWIKAVAEDGAAEGHISLSSLRKLCRLSLPYATGKAVHGATAALLTQVGEGLTPHLTKLCLGVHEFAWDISGLLGVAPQLVELELHNPFLKELWGLEPLQALHLSPLTAATKLTSLTISTLKLPTLHEIMIPAGQHPASARQGVAAAVAKLAVAGGPVAELVYGASIAAVADVLIARASPAARAAAGIAAGGQPLAALQQQQQDVLGPPEPPQSSAAAAAVGPDENGNVAVDRQQKALLLMARVVRADAKTAMAAAGVKLAEAQLQAISASGNTATLQQRQQRQQELAVAEAAAAAAAAAAGSSALLPGCEVTEGELMSARQSILALAAAVAPAAAAVVAGAGAPLPPAFAGQFLSNGTAIVPPPAAGGIVGPGGLIAAVAGAMEEVGAAGPGAAAAAAAAALGGAAAAAAGAAGGGQSVLDAAAAVSLASGKGFVQMFLPALIAAGGAGPGVAAPGAAFAAAAAAAGAAPPAAAAPAGGGIDVAAGQDAGPPAAAAAVAVAPHPPAAAAAPAVAAAALAMAAAPPPPPPAAAAAGTTAPAGLYVRGDWQDVGLLPLLVPPGSIGGVAHAAATAAAQVLLPQVPWLPQLRRLTLGTLHGCFRGAVGVAAMAPNLTCLEDLSGDMLAGLASLHQLTLNVDTLQSHARYASLTGLRMASEEISGSSGGSNGGSLHQQQQQQQLAGGKAGGRKKVKAKRQQQQQQQKQRQTAAQQMASRAERAAARAAAKAAAAAAAAAMAAAAADSCAAAEVLHAGMNSQAQGPQQQQQQDEQSPGNIGDVSDPLLATAAAALASGDQQQPEQQQQQQQFSQLVSGWRSAEWMLLGKLRCLRLLMLGNLHPEVIPPGSALPLIPGVTRLELCSAFGGRPEYAETYTTAEDPLLWQQQTGVKEMVIDGGVLLGGFLVEPSMASMLTERIKLDRLIVRRAPDMIDEHVEAAVASRLSREIVIVSDCEGVTEAGVVAAREGARGKGVTVSLVAPMRDEYADVSLSNSLEDIVAAV